MPRGRRAAASPPLTLGFAGSGELDQKAVVAMLDDLVEGRTVDHVFLPLTKDDTTDEIVHVHRWCVQHEFPYSVVSSEADVKSDRTLKKILDGAEYDYGVTEQGAGRDIVELLEGDDKDPVEDGRLLMFMDTGQEEDLDVFAHAQEHDVTAYDLLDDLSEITEGSDEPTPEPEPEPEPVDEVSARRGRRRGAAAAEPEPANDVGGYSKAEQKEYDKLVELGLTELKRMVKALDKSITTEQLKGTDRPYVADLIIVTRRNQIDAADAPDEAQATDAPAAGRRRRGAAQEAAEPAAEPSGGDDDTPDPKEAVFARLRGSREQAERIAHGMSAVARAELGLTDDADEVEVAAGMLAAALMAFAEYLIVEVRKPKSAGRPRADGTEAQPKPPVDPDAPKRPRGRPRKAVD